MLDGDRAIESVGGGSKKAKECGFAFYCGRRLQNDNVGAVAPCLAGERQLIGLRLFTYGHHERSTLSQRIADDGHDFLSLARRMLADFRDEAEHHEPVCATGDAVLHLSPHGVVVQCATGAMKGIQDGIDPVKLMGRHLSAFAINCHL